jgi:hypothetical protein
MWWIEQLKIIFRRPANKRGSEKMAGIRNALSVNTTSSKISIRKANKI